MNYLVGFVTGIVLSILATVFIKWDTFDPSTWEVYERVLWLYITLAFSVIGSIVYEYSVRSRQ